MNNTLIHYGILGMKWGVRRDRERKGRNQSSKNENITTKTKSGATVTLDKNHTPAFVQFLAKCSPKLRETISNSKSFKITAEGKTIGEMDLYKESSTSLNVVWVNVDKKHEGKGYGTAVMNAAIKYAKDTNCKQVTLEVPGISPNAKHIYEKLGFKETGETLGDLDDAWGGGKAMILKL